MHIHDNPNNECLYERKAWCLMNNGCNLSFTRQYAVQHCNIECGHPFCQMFFSISTTLQIWNSVSKSGYTDDFMRDGKNCSMMLLTIQPFWICLKQDRSNWCFCIWNKTDNMHSMLLVHCKHFDTNWKFIDWQIFQSKLIAKAALSLFSKTTYLGSLCSSNVKSWCTGSTHPILNHCKFSKCL